MFLNFARNSLIPPPYRYDFIKYISISWFYFF